MARYFGTPIQLAADPASAMQAATKQYVDAAALDAARQPGYPVDQYGFVASSLPVDSISGSTYSLTANIIRVVRIYVPANKAITGAAINLATAGTIPGSVNDSGFCLYLDDASAQVAKTVADYTIFTSTGWRSKAFPSQIAAQSVGRFVRLAVVSTCSGTTPAAGCSASTAASTWNALIPSGTHLRALKNTGTTTVFPASFTPSSWTSDNPVVFLGLY